MIMTRMVVKSFFGVSVKLLLGQSTNETVVLHVIVGVGALLSQLSERVNDDTENDVEANNDDDQVETDVEEETHLVSLHVERLVCLRRQELAYATTKTHTVVKRTQETVQERHADGVTSFVE